MGFPASSTAKEFTCHAGDTGSIPRSEDLQPTPVLLPGESYGQRSLAGCSPWGRKESEGTEHAHV